MKTLICIECGIKIKSHQLDQPCPACGSEAFKEVHTEITEKQKRKKGKKLTQIKEDYTEKPSHTSHDIDEYICLLCGETFNGDETVFQCEYCGSKAVELYLPIYESKMFYLRVFERLELFFLNILKPHMLLVEYLIFFLSLYMVVSFKTGLDASALVPKTLTYSLMGTAVFNISLFSILTVFRLYIKIFVNPHRLVKKHLPLHSMLYRKLRMSLNVLKANVYNPSSHEFFYHSLLVIKDNTKIRPKKNKTKKHLLLLHTGHILKGKTYIEAYSKKEPVFYEVTVNLKKGYIHKNDVLELDDLRNHFGLRLVINTIKSSVSVYEKPQSDSKKVHRLKKGEWLPEFYSQPNGHYYMKHRTDQLWGVMADEEWMKIFKNGELLGYMSIKGVLRY